MTTNDPLEDMLAEMDEHSANQPDGLAAALGARWLRANLLEMMRRAVIGDD